MHGDGARGAREGAGRGMGQSAITVHGEGARVHGKVQGNGAASDNGSGDGAGVYAEGLGGDGGRAR